MAPHVKAFAAEPDNLSGIARTHVVKERTKSPQVVPSPAQACTHFHTIR